jgi:superfamily II DNA helicase RecQ
MSLLLSVFLLLHRPEFGLLLSLVTHFAEVPVMALTATATTIVRQELSTLLRDPVLAISSVDKPNICLQAHELTKMPKNGRF